MKTCKDCIHDKACNDWAFTCGIPFVNATTCEHYKNKSRYIELPCKVGDTLYVNYRNIAYPVTVNAIRLDTKKNNHRICVWGTFHMKEYYSHEYKATFTFDSIGKSLFYTDAEAKTGLLGQISIDEVGAE